jgi:hypothetical protein
MKHREASAVTDVDVGQEMGKKDREEVLRSTMFLTRLSVKNRISNDERRCCIFRLK